MFKVCFKIPLKDGGLSKVCKSFKNGASARRLTHKSILAPGQSVHLRKVK
jgi:hypothetical protein